MKATSASFRPWFGEHCLSTPNTLWGALTANTFASFGLELAVISPGSRSTPLTYGFSRHPGLRCIPILDERSAAFFALGRAKATGKPVVCICTSGTAGANYYPALIEARYSHTPLIILTADRPPELRDCHSGQTIRQVGLYADYPVLEGETAFPALDRSSMEAHGRQLWAAWESATGYEAGPVHLNMPFRDPLPPDPEAAPIDPGFALEGLFAEPEIPQRKRILHLPFETRKRVLILAGPAHPVNPADYCRGVRGLSRALGAPVFAEALSPLRNFVGYNPYLISGYDTLLLEASVREAGRPDLVVQLGSLPTSKRLRAWLEEGNVPTVVVDPSGDNRDPLGRPVEAIRATVEDFAEVCGEGGDPDWLDTWLTRERAFRGELDRRMAGITERFEGKVAHTLGRILPEGTQVFIANSMPVRDAEFFWPVNDRGIRVLCNRGANGIDGTLSTALGAAHHGPPTVLLSGELAFLHDSNGLLQAHRLEGSLTVVLIENGGGAIFDNLPVHRVREGYRDYYRTPQAVDIRQLCGAHGVEHGVAEDWATLEAAVECALGQKGIRVIEIRTNPEHDIPFRRQLMRELAQAAEAANS